LDASPASIDFRIERVPSEDSVLVVCDDVGEGVDDLEKMQTVFWTSKTDSQYRRGRMGRGSKEMLVFARCATMESNERVIEFSHNADGIPVVETKKGDRRVGTRVSRCSLGRRKMPRILFLIFSVFWFLKRLICRSMA
jgi:hypothetical protein